MSVTRAGSLYSIKRTEYTTENIIGLRLNALQMLL